MGSPARLAALAFGVAITIASPAEAQQGGGHAGGGGGPGGGGPGGVGGGPGGAPGGPTGLGGGPSSSGSPGAASPYGLAAPPAGPPLVGLGPGQEADVVRDAVAKGESVSFDQVMAAVAAAEGGQVVGVNVLRRPTTGLAYLVKVLTDDGVLRQVTVDARSGTVLAVR